MSTDVNKLDTFLKKNLARDLCFRSILWLVIAAAAAYFVISQSELTAIQYFELVGNALMPVVNSLGVGGILLGILGWLLKDLEATMKDSKLVEATRGWIGGFVRRFAGDLTLWTLGVLITFFAVFAVALVLSPPSQSEIVAVARLGLFLLMLTIVTGVLNVCVRRNGPTPIVNKLKNPAKLALSYGAVFATIVFFLLIAPA